MKFPEQNVATLFTSILGLNLGQDIGYSEVPDFPQSLQPSDGTSLQHTSFQVFPVHIHSRVAKRD